MHRTPGELLSRRPSDDGRRSARRCIWHHKRFRESRGSFFLAEYRVPGVPTRAPKLYARTRSISRPRWRFRGVEKKTYVGPRRIPTEPFRRELITIIDPTRTRSMRCIFLSSHRRATTMSYTRAYVITIIITIVIIIVSPGERTRAMTTKLAGRISLDTSFYRVK